MVLPGSRVTHLTITKTTLSPIISRIRWVWVNQGPGSSTLFEPFDGSTSGFQGSVTLTETLARMFAVCPYEGPPPYATYVRAIIPETLPKVRSLKPGSRVLHLRVRVSKFAAHFFVGFNFPGSVHLRPPPYKRCRDCTTITDY